jgi:hypothetical protein
MGFGSSRSTCPTNSKRYGSDEIGVVYDVTNGHVINEDITDARRRCRSEFPPILAEIGYPELPVLEIISHQADQDILLSAEKLAMGYVWA